MKSSFKRNTVAGVLVSGLVLSAPSLGAHADCLHAVRAADMLSVTTEPHVESTVSMTDPGLDGLFDRYADLHRDAVGYVVADVTASEMVAKAATPEHHLSLTR